MEKPQKTFKNFKIIDNNITIKTNCKWTETFGWIIEYTVIIILEKNTNIKTYEYRTYNDNLNEAFDNSISSFKFGIKNVILWKKINFEILIEQIITKFYSKNNP